MDPNDPFARFRQARADREASAAAADAARLRVVEEDRLRREQESADARARREKAEALVTATHAGMVQLADQIAALTALVGEYHARKMLIPDGVSFHISQNELGAVIRVWSTGPSPESHARDALEAWFSPQHPRFF
jgi:hypothetical protein